MRLLYRIRVLSLLACLSLMVAARAGVGVGQSNETDSQEQTAFGAETPIQHPVELPDDVLKILRHDARNKTCLASGQSEELMPAAWFVASKVKLNNDPLEFVFIGDDPYLNGLAGDPLRGNSRWQPVLKVNLGLPVAPH